MRKKVDAAMMVAWCMIVCMTAVFPFTGHAGDLGMLEKRYANLSAAMDDDLSSCHKEAKSAQGTGKNDLFGFSRIHEAINKLAKKYQPMFKELSMDVEKADVPDELRDSRNELRRKIDGRMEALKKLESLDIEDLVDEVLNRMWKKERKNGDDDRDWSCLSLSCVPALEFPKREADVRGCRLNLLVGSHHDVSWIDVGGVANVVSNEFSGIQFAGVGNVVRHCTDGIQFAGLFNVGGWDFTGMQCSPGLNIAGAVDGIQLAGLGNLNLKMHGFQVAGGGNFTAAGSGCQIAVIGKNHADKIKGAQCGVCWNESHELYGMQLSALNLTDTCHGLQIGVFNKGDDVAGWQIGAINYAKTMSGCQIGLFNVIRTSSVPFLPVFNMGF